jgi:hypothetical protein
MCEISGFCRGVDGDLDRFASIWQNEPQKTNTRGVSTGTPHPTKEASTEDHHPEYQYPQDQHAVILRSPKSYTEIFIL